MKLDIENNVNKIVKNKMLLSFKITGLTELGIRLKIVRFLLILAGKIAGCTIEIEMKEKEKCK